MTEREIIKAHRAAINTAMKNTSTNLIRIKAPEAVTHYGKADQSHFLSEYKAHKEKLLKDFDEFKKKDDYPSLKDFFYTQHIGLSFIDYQSSVRIY